MLAARCSSSLLRPATRAPAAFRPVTVARPVRAAVPAARKALVIVSAAAVEAAETPVAEPTGPKSGVAHLSFQRGSVHKVRRILDVLRGRSYEEALILCEYMPYVACEKIIKVLMSAAANAKHNSGASKSKLFVKECFADGGPNLKRARPVSKGRAFRILKPTYHVTIRVEERA